MTDVDEVRAANQAFYAAFESLDRARMAAVWLDSPEVCCTHPGWRRLTGFVAVMRSWERIFANTFEMSFELGDVAVSLRGEVAWVACTENLTSKDYDGISVSRVEATNVFERHQGKWLLVNHHGSPLLAAPAEEPTDPRLH